MKTTTDRLNRTIAPPIKNAVDIDLHLKPYEKILLRNGLPIYTINAGVEEVMQLEFVLYAGNSFEEQNIIAAATNNLLKNGTRKRNAFSINNHFEYYGAYLNRACYNETATLTLHCLSKYLDKLLPVIREILTESVFPEQELEIFRQNSKQQLTVNLQKCDFVANRMIDKYLYGGQHPYGKFSTAEGFDALDAGMLRKFFAEHYRTGKCLIFAAGKLPADFEKQMNALFGDLDINEPRMVPAHATAPAPEKKSRIMNDPKGIQGAIRLARPFVNRHHPDYSKAVVLNTLLGGFFGSRLMANIREEKGYTYGIHSYIQNHIGPSAWMISTEAGVDVCEPALQEIYKEMQLLREELVDEEELLLVKNYMIGVSLGDLDGPFHIINRWKNLILNGLDEKYFYEATNTIRHISAEEIRELAKKYLAGEEFFELVVV